MSRKPNRQLAELRRRALELILDGATNGEVASELGVTPASVANWKVTFKADGKLDGLDLRQRRAKPLTVSELWVKAGGPTGYHMTSAVPRTRRAEERAAA